MRSPDELSEAGPGPNALSSVGPTHHSRVAEKLFPKGLTAQRLLALPCQALYWPPAGMWGKRASRQGCFQDGCRGCPGGSPCLMMVTTNVRSRSQASLSS